MWPFFLAGGLTFYGVSRLQTAALSSSFPCSSRARALLMQMNLQVRRLRMTRGTHMVSDPS